MKLSTFNFEKMMAGSEVVFRNSDMEILAITKTEIETKYPIKIATKFGDMWATLEGECITGATDHDIFLVEPTFSNDIYDLSTMD